MNLFEIWPVIAFIAVQTVAITWWAATVTSQLAMLRENFNTSKNNGERLVKIETSIENIEGTLRRLEEHMPKRRGT